MTVAIVGGGLAGLFTARRLVDSGIDDVVVLESSPQPGGVVRTVCRDGFVVEPGAGSFALPHPHLSGLLAGTDFQPAAPTARIRHVWTGSRLVTLPAGPAAVLAPLAPTRAKLRGLFEVMVAEPPGTDDESLSAFCQRRFGTELGRTVAWLAASGVFAGDPATLSARAAFPALTALVASDGSVLRGAIRRMRSRPEPAARPAAYVPSTTMSALADQLAAGLGDRFRPNQTVTAVRPDGARWIVEGDERLVADRVVLACAPGVAAGLVDGPLSETLGEAVAGPVLVVGLGGPADDMPTPDGFGILTGPDAATATRGVLLESSYAPHRAPVGHALVKVIAGGSPRHPVWDADDATVIETIGTEVARITGVDIAASFTEVIRHAQGIPQYPVGHHRWLARVEEETPATLHLTGWGYRGVGVAHLASDAFRIAGTIAA